MRPSVTALLVFPAILGFSWQVQPSKPQSTPASSQASKKKEHTFQGTVSKVDASSRTLTVSGESVPGWMAAMTMTYHVDKPAILTTVKTGDHIAAKVYDGDFTTLHDVRIVTINAADANALPPVSYVCNTQGQDIVAAAAEASIIDDKPGKCPQTGAPLVPVRLDTVYTCLKFQSFIQENPGICPVDKTELVPVTMGLYFTCKGDASIRQLDPGACADGSARIKAYQPRPHGDHNPRHGGQFFMADDSWHHLEGTFVRPNLFRVYFYNDMTRPLPVSGFSATLTKTDANGKDVTVPIALETSPTNDSNILQASIPGATLPASFALQVKFKPNDKERVFDFTFADYSNEPVGAPPTPALSTAAASQSAQAPSATPSGPASPQTGATTDTAVPLYPYSAADQLPGAGREEVLPTTTPELLAELAQRAQSVKMLLDEGNLGSLWTPAISAKDVALALQENHIADVSEAQRPKLTSAVKRLTLIAWQIDAAGDLGNKERLLPLYQDFAAAVADIQAAYAAQ